MKRIHRSALVIIAILTSLSGMTQSTQFLDHFQSTRIDTGMVIFTGVRVALSGEIYACGIFSDGFDADPGSGTTLMQSNGDFDCFIIKLTPQGDLIWVRTFGGADDDEAAGLGIDDAGNIYYGGYINDSVDLDPSSGVLMAYSPGYNDIFLISLTANGDFRWGHSIAGTGSEEVMRIATDRFGNSVITGDFNDSLDFDPGPAVNALVREGVTSDIFVAKFAGDGALVWAKRMGGKAGDGAYGIAIDPWGYVLTTGVFSDTADFDPSPNGTFNLISPYSNFESDIFVSKLSPSGDFVWARAMGGPDLNGGDYGLGIATDSAGNSYSIGQFDGVADFDPSPASVHSLTAMSDQDGYVLKLDSGGNFSWAVPLNGSSSEMALNLTASQRGNVYVTGYFDAEIDMDPGPGTHLFHCSTNNSGTNAYLLELDPVAAFVSARQITGDLSIGIAVGLDAAEYPVWGGYFQGLTDFDSVPGANALTSVGMADGFLIGRINPAFSVEASFDQKRLTLYPNPASNTVNLELESAVGSKVLQFEIHDLTGRVLHQSSWNGANVRSIDVAAFPAGAYNLTLYGAGWVESTRWVKQ